MARTLASLARRSNLSRLLARPRFAATAAVVALALLQSPSGAAPPRARVTIVARERGFDGVRNEFETQLRSELLTSGFEVVTITEARAPTSTALEAVADKTGSFAAISLIEPSSSAPADIWISDRVTGKTLFRHVRPDELSGQAASIFAIRAVELLRASLLELHDGHPARGDTKATPALRQWSRPRSVAPRTDSWGLSVGAAVVVSHFDQQAPNLPASWSPSLLLAYKPAANWAIELAGTAPAVAPLAARTATLTVHQEIASIRLRLEPDPAGAVVVPFVALGGGVLHVSASAEPVGSGFAVTSQQAWGALGVLSAGLRLRATEGFGFLLAADVLAAAPRPVLRFADGQAVTLARPTLLGTLALDVGF